MVGLLTTMFLFLFLYWLWVFDVFVNDAWMMREWCGDLLTTFEFLAGCADEPVDKVVKFAQPVGDLWREWGEFEIDDSFWVDYVCHWHHNHGKNEEYAGTRCGILDEDEDACGNQRVWYNHLYQQQP